MHHRARSFLRRNMLRSVPFFLVRFDVGLDLRYCIETVGFWEWDINGIIVLSLDYDLPQVL